MNDVSESLISLTKNDWPWGIRSGRSEEMSNREPIAQFAHQKWANEWIAHIFEQIAHLLIFGQKGAIRSEIKWANSQPCFCAKTVQHLKYYLITGFFRPVLHIMIFLPFILFF